MRRDSFAGRDRKIVPVLLGFVLLGVFAVAQDIGSRSLTGPLVGYMIL
jgi:hypothetical protein